MAKREKKKGQKLDSFEALGDIVARMLGGVPIASDPASGGKRVFGFGVEAGSGRSWSDAVAPIVQKFEVAAAFDKDTVFNTEGSRALGALLKEMGRLLDIAAQQDRQTEG